MTGLMENRTAAVYYASAVDPPTWLYYKYNENGSNSPSNEDYTIVHSPPEAPSSTTGYLLDWTDLVLAVLFSVLIVVTIVSELFFYLHNKHNIYELYYNRV